MENRDSTSRQSLNHRDSEQTIISLLELDPSPMDSPTPSEANRQLQQDEENTTTVPASSDSASFKSTTAAPGLSSSHASRGTLFYLSRIQRYSSYAMSIFTSLHLANVSLIPAVQRSVPASETYLLMTREIYQTALTEPLLVALPVLAHVGSGVALRALRRRQNMRRYGAATPAMYALHRRSQQQADGKGGAAAPAVSLWPPLSYISASGYAFTVFYAAHVFMNRVLPLAVEGDSANVGLAYVAHGFARHPVLARLAYLGLVVVGSGHMVWGMARWLGVAPSTGGWHGSAAVVLDRATKRRRRSKWLSVQGAVGVTVAAWAVGGLAVVARGGLQDGWVGKVYDDLFSRVGL